MEARAVSREEYEQLYSALTERQKEVLQQTANGLSMEEIGANLHIAPKTVEAHRMDIGHRMLEIMPTERYSEPYLFRKVLFVSVDLGVRTGVLEHALPPGLVTSVTLLQDEVISQMALGFSNTEIASSSNRSLKTVEARVTRIRKALAVNRNRMEIVSRVSALKREGKYRVMAKNEEYKLC